MNPLRSLLTLYNYSFQLLIASLLLLLSVSAHAEYIWSGNITLDSGDGAPGAVDNRATGSVGTVNYTISSTSGFKRAQIWNPGTFDNTYNVPGDTGGNNATPVYTFNENAGGTYTLTFDRPVENPLIAIASLGQVYQPSVTFTFGSSVDLLWTGTYETHISAGVTPSSGTVTSITGVEGYAIARYTGTVTSVTFNPSAETNGSMMVLVGFEVSTTAPQITAPSGVAGASTAVISVQEGTTAVGDFEVNKAAVWSVSGGANSSLFSIDSATGELTFNSAPSYNVVGNNTYVVELKATDLQATPQIATQIVTVNVTPTPTAPTITTQAVSAITSTTATGNGNITGLGSSNPSAHGVCYGTSASPTSSTGTCTDEGAASATGAFTTSLTGLTASTTYYVRAYATNSVATSYGSDVTFTTTSATAATLSPPTQSVTGSVATAITATTAYTASNFSGTVSYAISGTLPSGLSFNTTTGVVSGTPTSSLTSTSYTVTATGSSSGSATATISISVTYPDPTSNADVVGSIQAAMNSSRNFVRGSLKSVEMRMDWLRRHKDELNKSVQGINVAFADPLLQQFVNGDPRALEELKLVSATDALTQYGQNPDRVMSDVKSVPVEIAMAEAQKKFGKADLNPTGGKVMGDWFLWTAGQVTVGKAKNSSSSVTNESEALTLALGMDKSDKDSMYGFAVNVSKDITDIGTVGSKQKSYGASLSLYGGFNADSLPPMEFVLGVGHMDIKSTRINGSQKLTGSRNARTVFGSIGLISEAMEQGKATITPYSKLEAAYINLGGYTESGRLLALAYDRQIVKQAMLKVGVDAHYDTGWMNGKLTPFTRFEYAHDFSPSSNADMHYVGDATNYRLTTDKNAVSNWTLRLGSDYAHSSGASTSVFYEHTQSINSDHSDSIQLKVSLPF